MLPVLHNVDTGIERLLAAPRDLPLGSKWTGQPIARAAASPEHRLLFDRYRVELADAAATAEIWWRGMLSRAEARGTHGPEAVRGLYASRPAGPASHPAVVRVVRKYWLACDATNKSHQPIVPPEVFLIWWLVECRMERELVILTAMPYWPIGMDPEGQWI